jgi:hypothetical protein
MRGFSVTTRGDIGDRKCGAVGYKGCEMGRCPPSAAPHGEREEAPNVYARSQNCMKITTKGASRAVQNCTVLKIIRVRPDNPIRSPDPEQY